MNNKLLLTNLIYRIYSLNCLFCLDFHYRTVIQSVREKQWEYTPPRASFHTDPSGSKCPTDLPPVSSCFSITIGSNSFPCIECDYHDYVFGICFRHADGGGVACSSRLDRVLLPHHPHHCGQGRQQEAHTYRGTLTVILLLLAALIKL